jgi:hypothetical protein
MLFLSLYVLAVVAMFVITVRSRPDGRPVVLRARLRPPRPAHAPPGPLRRQIPRPAGRPENPESIEGMLTVLLIGGEITRSQYRRAVEEIAAQDEVGRPLTFPPDPGAGRS